MDRLEADFPALSWLAIYKAVAAARVEAAQQLPDVEAYRIALEQHARETLRACEEPDDAPVLSLVPPARST
jgi:hypothetical protein